MISVTTRKGDMAEAMIAADLMRRGLRVARPLSHGDAFDLIAIDEYDRFYRVQCKYTESNGSFIRVRCRRAGADSVTFYTAKNIDWLANFDLTTGRILYIPAKFLGEKRNQIDIRLNRNSHYSTKPKNWHEDFSKPRLKRPDWRIKSVQKREIDK